jgi:polyphosphate glucokinase
MARHVLGFDVGGSSVKAGIVDLEGGRLLGELSSAATPQPSTPSALLPVFSGLIARLPEAQERFGLAFPSVVQRGIVRTAANIDPGWIGVDGAALIQGNLHRPAVFLNDADAAGLAEVTLGAGRGCHGTVIMLTFGTGIGTALFVDGRLFPNTELGHLEVNGADVEKWASAHARTVEKLDWPQWVDRVNVYLQRMQGLFWPDLFIFGGAVSGRFQEFADLLRADAQIRPAHFAGQAGVIGAALAAGGAV